MASQKQIDANRKNAKRSKGPTSIEGKAKSRCNAVRDGLTGQVITLAEEDRPFFEQLIAEILADLNPQGALERKLAHSIAWDTWRLDHLRAVENNVYTFGRENTEDDDPGDADPIDIARADTRTYRTEAPRLELMSLYESRMTRNLHRNVALLRELQAERKRNYERDKKEEIQIARLCEFNDMPIKASIAPSKNGFVFSNEEIAVAAVRDRYAAAAAYFLKNGKPSHLFGGLIMAAGDTIMEELLNKRPLSDAERHEIESVPPEVRAIHRLTHPEKYGVRLVS
jgi:hypothetical protein